MISDSPILFIGIDVGISRDTAARVAVYWHNDCLVVWGHKIITPTTDQRVNIARQITNPTIELLRTQRVAGIWFDPYQFIGETQRIADMGYARFLHEVNQQTENPAFANALETMVNNGTLIMYPDAECRAHMLWTTAKNTERGRRIVKAKQTKPIDYTVALAMAVYGAVSETGMSQHPGFVNAVHTREMEAVP